MINNRKPTVCADFNKGNFENEKIWEWINAFCIRHGFCYDGRKWTQAHLKWIKKLEMVTRSSMLLMDEYIMKYPLCGITIG